jgi:hypothetical protein
MLDIANVWQPLYWGLDLLPGVRSWVIGGFQQGTLQAVVLAYETLEMDGQDTREPVLMYYMSVSNLKVARGVALIKLKLPTFIGNLKHDRFLNKAFLADWTMDAIFVKCLALGLEAEYDPALLPQPPSPAMRHKSDSELT